MPAYTVEGVQGEPREWEGKFGKNLSYTLALKDVEGVVELSQKPETPAPQVGQTLEGEIQPSSGSFPPRFKKAQRNGGGFGGPRPEDPERAKRIVRQHSEEMALRYATIQLARGKLPEDFSLETLKPIIDWFEKDATG